MGKEELFDILKNIQADQVIPERLAEAVQFGSKEGVEELLKDLPQLESIANEGEVISLIKELTSGMSQEQMQELGDFMEQSVRQLGCDQLSTVFLKLLAEIEQE